MIFIFCFNSRLIYHEHFDRLLKLLPIPVQAVADHAPKSGGGSSGPVLEGASKR
ncbi:MAG: hypothetical protein MJE68_12520 [Proteobacteria bacterium]|nr:hypothetical protein [Pseudomonadota bacterium]